MEQPKQKNENKYGSAMKYAALGTQMMVLLGLGVFGGMKFDEMLHTSPLFLVLLPVLALFLSLYQLYRQLVKKQ